MAAYHRSVKPRQNENRESLKLKTTSTRMGAYRKRYTAQAWMLSRRSPQRRRPTSDQLLHAAGAEPAHVHPDQQQGHAGDDDGRRRAEGPVARFQELALDQVAHQDHLGAAQQVGD